MKNKRKASLLLGSLIMVLIIISPYLLYVSESIPSDITELDTIFGVIKGGYYNYVQTYVYFIFAKFVPFFLLSILFITNKNWWAPAILIPISVYLFQLISVINDSREFIDDIEFIYTTPILVPILVILFFIRSKISIYIQAIDLKKEMDLKMENPKKQVAIKSTFLDRNP